MVFRCIVVFCVLELEDWVLGRFNAVRLEIEGCSEPWIFAAEPLRPGRTSRVEPTAAP